MKRAVPFISTALTVLLILLLPGCISAPEPPSFYRLTDGQTLSVVRRGPSFFEGDSDTRFGPMAECEDAPEAKPKGDAFSGALRVPPNTILRGIQISLEWQLETPPHRVIVHVFEDNRGGPELKGFPASFTWPGKRSVMCGDLEVKKPLLWTVEIDHGADHGHGSAFTKPPGFSCKLWPILSDIIEFPVGINTMRAFGETRPSIVLTPGTILSCPFPEGIGWHLETGLAQFTPGCKIDVFIETGSCTTAVASMSSERRRWVDYSFRLPESNEQGRLFLECSAVGKPKEGCLVLGDPVLRKAPERHPEKPNVLLISLDTVRADYLDLWSEDSTLPGFGELAGDFVVFRQARANAPVTHTSHLTLFSGLIVPRHTPLGGQHSVMLDEIEPLSTILADRGYRSSAFTDGGLVGAAYGFHKGFDRYYEYPGTCRNKTHLPGNLYEARKWINKENRYGPWFAFVHSYQAHAPYVDHETSGSLPVDINVAARMSEQTPLISQATVGGDVLEDEEEIVEIATRHYGSEVSYLVRHIKSFLNDLDEAGILDKTIVIMFSDHGEGFGEHGLLGHNNSVYEEQLVVPLMIRFPDGKHGGTTVPGVVQLADVLPTVLDYLDIQTDTSVDGISLMSFIRENRHPPQRAIVSTHAWQSAVVQWPHKMIVGRADIPTRLFDLERDPLEWNDILESADSSLVRTMKQAFTDVLFETTPGWALIIERPDSLGPPLLISEREREGWFFYFTVPADRVVLGKTELALQLGPSQIGDVVVMFPNPIGVSVRSPDGPRTKLEPNQTHRVDTYRIHVRECHGVDPKLRKSSGLVVGAEHEAKLRALGYIQ